MKLSLGLIMELKLFFSVPPTSIASLSVSSPSLLFGWNESRFAHGMSVVDTPERESAVWLIGGRQDEEEGEYSSVFVKSSSSSSS